MELDTHIPVSAANLGFALPAPPEEVQGPPSHMVDTLEPTLSPDKREKMYTDLIRQDSLVSVQEISRDLAKVALDPTTTIPQRLNINEQLIKLAGLDKKTADATAIGGGVSITINLPTRKPIHVEQAAVVEAECVKIEEGAQVVDAE